MKFGEKFSGMLSRPNDTFRRIEREDATETTKYLLLMSIIPAVLSGLLIYIGVAFLIPKASFTRAAIMTISMYLAWVIGTLIGSIWYHIWLLVMGYKGKLSDTYKAMVYGLTPSYLFAWIPLVGWLAYIWSAILFIFGTSRYGKIDWWRSLVALIIAAVIPAVIAVFVVGLALIGSLI